MFRSNDLISRLEKLLQFSGQWYLRQSMQKSFKGQEESWIMKNQWVGWYPMEGYIKIDAWIKYFFGGLLTFGLFLDRQHQKVASLEMNMLMDVDHTPQKLLTMLTVRWKTASHRKGEVKGLKGPIQNHGSCESGQVVEHTKFLGDCLGSGKLGDQRLILSVRLIIQILHQRMSIYILNILHIIL